MPEPSTAPVISPFLNAVIGGITGAIEISITYPTEYTKTVMQLFKEKQKLGAIGVIKQTMRQRGFFGLYRGYSALLFFSVPKNYVRFGAYSIVKDNYLTEKSKINTFLCGLAAGAAEAMLVVTIQETLKVQLIHDKFMPEPKYRNLFHGIYSIVSKETGLLGLYKGKETRIIDVIDVLLGGVETLMKQSSNQGVRFLVYQDTQEFLKKYIGIDFLRNLIAGAFAGFCSVMANNPIDVIKTLRQGKDAHKYPSTKAAISKIWGDSGIFGFYRGVTPRLMRVCLDVALTFAIFNGIKSKIKQIIIKRRQAKESSS